MDQTPAPLPRLADPKRQWRALVAKAFGAGVTPPIRTRRPKLSVEGLESREAPSESLASLGAPVGAGLLWSPPAPVAALTYGQGGAPGAAEVARKRSWSDESVSLPGRAASVATAAASAPAVPPTGASAISGRGGWLDDWTVRVGVSSSAAGGAAPAPNAPPSPVTADAGANPARSAATPEAANPTTLRTDAGAAAVLPGGTPAAPAAPPASGATGAPSSDLSTRSAAARSAAVLANPSYVLDANKGAVLTEASANRDFAGWTADLVAQVRGAAVTAYAWDLSGAPDATGVTGQAAYHVQFAWGSFAGAVRAESVGLTTTFAGGATQTQTFAFKVEGTDSPAWSAAPPTTAASFPAATTEDLTGGEPGVPAGGASLGLATGRVTAAHALPAYNPDVPATALAYGSTAADPRPVVRVRYALPDGVAVPPTVTAQLTFNGAVSPAVVYGTGLMNPGDVLEFALQGDATGLATGRYDYSVAVVGPAAVSPPPPPVATATKTGSAPNSVIGGGGGSTVTTTYAGRLNVVNDTASPDGAGWSVAGVRRLVTVSDGLLIVSAGGRADFRPGSGGGASRTAVQAFADGPGDFSGLTRNADGTYTQTLTDGTVITFSAAGLQTSVADRDGNATAYGYDAAGKLLAVTDRHGLVTTFAYTAAGKLQTVTDPAGRATGFAVTSGKLATITDADAGVWGYGYDAAGRLTDVTDPTSRQTVVTYGAGGRAASAKWGTGAPQTLTPQAVYGLAVAPQGTAANPAPAALAAESASVSADRRGNATATRFDWSGFGSAARVDAPDGGVAVAAHDPNDLPWLAGDPLGRRTRTFFDAKGNPTTGVNADNTSVTSTYNAFAEPLIQTDELGRTTASVYNARGDRTSFTDPLGKQSTQTFNADGTTATATDALLHTTTFAYDARGRLTSQTDALGHAATFGYDAKGNKTSTTDALAHATAATFDAMNRPLTSTDARGGVTRDVYDAAGRLLTLTDPVGNVTTYAYSAAVDQVATVTDPRGAVTSSGYDADGHLIQVTDRNARVRQFTFDPVGRPAGETWRATAGGPVTYAETAAYDAAGQLVSLADPFSADAYTYDARGRVLTDDNAGTPGVPHVVLTQGYDAVGDLAAVADNFGAQVGYGYSARKELTGASLTVGGALGANAAYGYDAAGRQVSVTRREGSAGPTVGTTLGYDSANRLTGIAHASSAAGALSAFAYGYDAANRLATYTGPDGTLGYAYDATNQLTAVTGSAAESFGYDPNGNRNSAGYGVGAGNRLTADGAYTYAYDAEGNRTGKTRVSDGQVTLYTYDQRNRLTDVQVKTAGGVLLHDESSTYDAGNRRIGVNTDGVQVWTAYRGDNAWADFTAAGAVQTRYLFGLGMDSLVARVSAAGAVGWYLTDNLGSVRQVVITAGGVLYSASYAAYGQVKAAAGAGGDRFGYAGREWSRVTGEGYYRARQYDPASGRFLSQDPMGFAANDANLYRYVSNLPNMHVDPTGNFNQTIDLGIEGAYRGGQFGGFVGAAGGTLAGIFLGKGDPKSIAIGAGAGYVVGAVLGSVSGGVYTITKAVLGRYGPPGPGGRATPPQKTAAGKDGARIGIAAATTSPLLIIVIAIWSW